MSSEMREFAGKADALAKRWRDDAKGLRERDMISAADDADFYAEELEAILPSAEADNGLYGPLTGAQEASMRGYCIAQLQAVEDEYPDTGKFIREWLTHVENERNRLFAALLARTEAAYREMEALQLRYVDEDADVHRAMYRMQSEHQQALRRAEEDGYAKGVRDAEKDSAPAGSGEVSDEMVRAACKEYDDATDVLSDRASYKGMRAAIAALTARLEAAEGDARRYRWLRSEDRRPGKSLWVAMGGGYGDLSRWNCNSLDQRIDAAIGAGVEGG